MRIKQCSLKALQMSTTEMAYIHNKNHDVSFFFLTGKSTRNGNSEQRISREMRVKCSVSYTFYILQILLLKLSIGRGQQAFDT